MAPQLTKTSNIGKQTLQRLGILVLGIFISALFFSLSSPAYARQGNKHVEKRYSVAKSYYNQLQFAKNLSRAKKNWQQSARYFIGAYKADPYHKLAPASLLTLGHIYYKMYQKFGSKNDLAESLSYYDDVVSLFPQHRFADDALYLSGKITAQEQKDYQSAALIFAKLLAVYPSGDMVSKAGADLKKAKSKSAARPKPHAPKPMVPADDSSLWSPPEKPTGQMVEVVNLRHWSTTNYTRVVIETSSPVTYKDNLLKQEGDKPHRLYVNLDNCRIGKNLTTTVPINDGLLKRIRSAQFTTDKVRVVLDTQSLSQYNIFSLNDPFRIVIDVKGAQQQVAAPEKFFIPNAPSLAQQLCLKINKIIIDPGHGGKDPGAIGVNGLREKDVVLKVAKLLARKLEKETGSEVLLTRKRDVFLRLEERTAIANTEEGDLFISIHANAAPNKEAKGVETYYLSMATTKEEMQVAALENQASNKTVSDLQKILTIMRDSKIEESAKFAKIVQKNMVEGLSSKYRDIGNHGVKKAPFIVLIGAQMPAILAEIAFVTNSTDANRLKSDAYLNDVANQIAEGIKEYVSVLNMAKL
jgi:N-acetylmuramoyl-L-alanine amidase